jgi:hypothetical protein
VDPLHRATYTPHRIGRHAHPQARTDPDTVAPPPTTGIDYLRLVEGRHGRDLAAAGGIEFHQLALPDELIPQPRTTTEEDKS